MPTGHTFHADTAAIGLAGISVGCGGGNFCPDGTLTRAQEAAFLQGGLGRAAGANAASVTVNAGVLTTVATVTITPGVSAGAVAGANGFLLISGHVTLYEGVPDNCVCSTSVRIYVDGSVVPGTQYVFIPDNTTFEAGSASISVVVPVTAGAKTVSLRVNEYQGNESLVGYGAVTALYVPFGSSGTDVMAASSSDVADDPMVPAP